MLRFDTPRTRRAIGAGLAAAALLVSAGAQAQTAEDRWSFSLTPYLWLPNVNGTLKYSLPPSNTGSPDVETGPNNYLQNLQAALMLSGTARKGEWSVSSDLIYLSFANQKSSVKAVDFGGSTVDTSLNSSTSSSLKGWLWTLAGGYELARTPRATLEAIGGVRYLSIRASTDWQLTATVNGPGGGQVFPASGSIAERTDLWDPIVGVRGRVNLGDGKWHLPYYLDVGAGSSKLTWQALLGVSYAFSWGEAVLAYRHLAYDQKDEKLLQDFRFSGPALGVTFIW
jgi:opacity protein-like surface antigen